MLYFASMVFSMVIYYTFVSLQYSEEIQESILLSDMMSFMFQASSVILILFVAVFIFYSNAFFTRNRKKEVGLYSMLGLRKKTIGKMLFYENLIMGIVAVVIGIVFGTVLSKLFAMILVHLMDSVAEVDFGISIKAIVQTIVVFMVIILCTSIQGYRLIYRFKLIELFHAQKKGDKQPTASVFSAIAGVILLAVSYFLILRPFPEELTNEYILTNYGTAFIALVMGTHFFFRSVTVYVLKLSRRNKTRYYRGTKMIETSQLLHRIRGNANTFTIIALLSVATISLFGATYSGYVGNEKNAMEMVPFSYNYLSEDGEVDTQVEKWINADEEHPVKAQLDIPVIEMSGEPTFQLDYDTNLMKMISESTFNHAAKALDRDETVQLSGNEAAIIKPRLTEFTVSDFKGEGVTLQYPQENRDLTFVNMVEGNVLPFDYPDLYMVVSDEMFAETAGQMEVLTYKVYEVENEKSAETTSKRVNGLVGQDFRVASSFYTEYKSGKEGNALNLFIFGFLGLVFLVATGSIIYFKQLTEANESKGSYEIVRKIGLGKKAIRKAINKQTLFVFGLPLTVGIAHSSVILYFISNFISDLIGTNLTVPILTAMGAFVMIYACYYMLTLNTYNNIVNK